ncbi:pantoate--beta-alanine ligase [Paenibacillus sp. 598K]|uniref:pantoate--beta-alanine ligase n=1 Tax=Paenibacillus sp. 598K TaxID=1117987 RepID=UPI000FF9A55E|nr:pantoate--beta-alanine ligase [Paenibacillus sp. 598K]GBF72805.1 pantoate--beta-alanine ligase [Paenibacillus sp. 598K]
MILCTTIDELRAYIRAYRTEHPDALVGLVPTMGYLHEGHASLIRRSAAECGLTVVSLFVNPLQFGPGEDFDRYPRDPERDAALSAAAGADVLFMPSVEEMYPRASATRVLVSGVTERLCGASRPGHFDGVGTVVSKLFHIVLPDRAYFGMKDAQQVAVIVTMTEDLNFPIEIVPCETVREADGLAMSSRNVYLSEQERREAVVLSQALSRADGWLREGLDASETTARVREHIGSAPLADIDYVDVLRFPELTEPAPGERLAPGQRWIAAVAVRFGRTRLIDNRIFSGDEVAAHV